MLQKMTDAEYLELYVRVTIFIAGLAVVMFSVEWAADNVFGICDLGLLAKLTVFPVVFSVWLFFVLIQPYLVVG